MAGRQAVGIVVIAASLIIGILLLVSAVGTSSGQPGGSNPIIVCDLQVTVSGTVYDLNVNPTVTGWDISSPKSINCREKTVGDYIGDIFSYALFGTGYTDITTKAFDENGRKVRDGSGFTVITQVLEPSKSFSQTVTIEGLEKGKAYDIRTFTSWGNDIPQYNKQITVQ